MKLTKEGRKIKHFFTALNFLKTIRKQREYLKLVKDRDYNDIMKCVDFNNWLEDKSYRY